MNGLLLSVLFAVVYTVHSVPVYTEQDERDFKSWMSQFNRKYEKDEYYKRLQIFLENKKMIDDHNAGNHSYTMGLNDFADLTSAEFSNYYIMSEPQTKKMSGSQKMRRRKPKRREGNGKKERPRKTPGPCYNLQPPATNFGTPETTSNSSLPGNSKQLPISPIIEQLERDSQSRQQETEDYRFAVAMADLLAKLDTNKKLEVKSQINKILADALRDGDA
ncbi:uncharacterized protein [Misgurnus anguillicaudatus]|uniref:uncharacterized protein isoform X1 n=1 Tax=Misgurnus anguillicaudatus TaxID=75329 RepID=UPI003CCFA060